MGSKLKRTRRLPQARYVAKWVNTGHYAKVGGGITKNMDEAIVLGWSAPRKWKYLEPDVTLIKVKIVVVEGEDDDNSLS